MKIKHDNNVTHPIGLIYAENDTNLLKLIRPSVVYDKTKQDNDVTDYILCGLRRNRNWTIETYRIKYGMLQKPDRARTWPIV